MLRHIKEVHDCYDQIKKPEMPDFLVDIPVGCDVIPHYLHADATILQPGFSLSKTNEELSRKVGELMGHCQMEDEKLFKRTGECPARFLYTRIYSS